MTPSTKKGQHEGVAHRADAAGDHGICQDDIDVKIDLHHRQAKDARQHQPQDIEDAGDARRKQGAKSRRQLDDAGKLHQQMQ